MNHFERAAVHRRVYGLLRIATMRASNSAEGGCGAVIALRDRTVIKAAQSHDAINPAALPASFTTRRMIMT
jgi:hypothetical protein